jgi:hypothetical protein
LTFFEPLPARLFLGAMKSSTLVAGGLFVLSLAVTFLLPHPARQSARAH